MRPFTDNVETFLVGVILATVIGSFIVIELVGKRTTQSADKRTVPHHYVARCSLGRITWTNQQVTKFETEGDVTKFYVEGKDYPVFSVKHALCVIAGVRDPKELQPVE